MGPDGKRQKAPFAFWAPLYEEVLHQGREAHSHWIGATSPEVLDYAWGEGVKPPYNLPLSALVRVANNLYTDIGDREAISFLIDDMTPARSFVAWLVEYKDHFETFFPEQLNGDVPRALSWTQGVTGQTLWEQIIGTSTELHEALDLRSPLSASFFVLVRDHLLEIAPIVEGAGIDTHSLVLRAREDMLDNLGTWKESVQAGQQQLERQWGLGGGASTMFAAFITDGRSALTAELQGSFGVEEMVARVRHAESKRISGLQRLWLQSRMVSDLPARVDRLGISPLVQGLHALLIDPGTSLPLAIAVTAPWGGGKSSLMLQLQNELTSQNGSNGRTWIPIRFDAWKYEHGERLWAALGKAIYGQPQEDWIWPRRAKFKMRLQWRRAGGLSLFLKGVVAPLVLAIATVLLALVADALVSATILGAAALAAVANSAARVLGIVSDPFKRALDRYVEEPKYEEHLGFTTEADEDIAHLTALLTEEPGSALAIFIDDLDRCSPAHVVEVVEAINQIFNYDVQRQCVFILGMDREVVAASIEVAYEDTIAKLRDKERAQNFGFAFLAKLVQLSVSIPPPRRRDVKRLLASTTTPLLVDHHYDEQRIEKFEDEIGARDPSSVAEVEKASRDLDQNSLNALDQIALDEARMRGRSRALGGDSVAIREAVYAVADYLPANPREVKRFENAFRLQLQVANRTPGCGFVFDLNDLVVLGKWVVLRLRWPELAEQLDADPDLLHRLEEICSRHEGAGCEPLLDDPALRRLLTEPVEGRRLARLSDEVFLRVS